MSASPDWRRAARVATAKLLAKTNRCSAARLALGRLLALAGYPVSLATIHSWSRGMQADAYLWAAGRVYWGETSTAPPYWVAKAKVLA